MSSALISSCFLSRRRPEEPARLVWWVRWGLEWVRVRSFELCAGQGLTPLCERRKLGVFGKRGNLQSVFDTDEWRTVAFVIRVALVGHVSPHCATNRVEFLVSSYSDRVFLLFSFPPARIILIMRNTHPASAMNKNTSAVDPKPLKSTPPTSTTARCTSFTSGPSLKPSMPVSVPSCAATTRSTRRRRAKTRRSSVEF